uniref:Uncharacterized protein n=1 Tax=Solanum lycopersicum TaxID=4081 RepID=A0A3Q7FIH4_SOLLC
MKCIIAKPWQLTPKLLTLCEKKKEKKQQNTALPLHERKQSEHKIGTEYR